MANHGIVYGADGRAQRGWTWHAGDPPGRLVLAIDPGGWVEQLDPGLTEAELDPIMQQLHERRSEPPAQRVPLNAPPPLWFNPLTGAVIHLIPNGPGEVVCALFARSG